MYFLAHHSQQPVEYGIVILHRSAPIAASISVRFRSSSTAILQLAIGVRACEAAWRQAAHQDVAVLKL
jgi:hypothetical protein